MADETDTVEKADGAVGFELGQTGLKEQSGVVNEEWLRSLTGQRGRAVLAEMRDNDPTVGAGLYGLSMLVRRADWRTTPPDDVPEDDPDVEFAESLRLDMSHSWSAMIGEIMSGMPVFGWQAHEIVYKRRSGENAQRPGDSSRYSDGLIGWRKMAVRAQETLVRWAFDESGGINGMVQRVGAAQEVFIPVEKLVLFRTSTARGNPEGRSALRNAYRPWYLKKRTEDSEAIGIERTLTGIPRFWLPAAVLDPAAQGNLLAQRTAFETIGKNLRRDEQASVFMPLEFDDKGNKRYDMDLITSPGGPTIDTAPVLTRYAQQIAMTLLADVILLGHEKVGTQALADTKIELLCASLDAWLDGIAEVFNRHALPRVFALNGRPTGVLPTYEPASVKPDDVAALVDALVKLSGAGAPLFPDRGLEEWLADKVGYPMPEEVDDPLVNQPPPPPVLVAPVEVDPETSPPPPET